MAAAIDGTPLWNWINERHRIYQKRFEVKADPPWTDDPIFQQYRFCNVFRELDTVTIWIREHIREPLADHPLLWFWLALARNINWPQSLEDIQNFSDTSGYPDYFDPQGVEDVLSTRATAGKKVFGSAYVITNGGQPIPKQEYVAWHVADKLWRSREVVAQLLECARTLQDAWNTLRNYEGFGPFIAYEVVTDLRHTRYLSNAKDIYSWANAGPGAKRGLNRLLGQPAEAPMAPRAALEHMRALCAYANQPAGGDVLGPHIPRPLEMRDIEHSLCEMDKYLRAKTGEGRPKQQFRPGAVYGNT